jgi:uncharacterized protein (UPF0332 family)
MNASEFLDCAAFLLKAGTAAANRSAVSRAYYGAFHVAKTILEKSGFRFLHNDRSHGEVNRYLSWSDDQNIKDAASLLSDLRGARNRADYDLANPQGEAARHATHWVELANECAKLIEDGFNGDRKDAIIQAIKANQRKITGAN